MVMTPDRPLLPDHDGNGREVRPYEEALPREIYVPPDPAPALASPPTAAAPPQIASLPPQPAPQAPPSDQAPWRRYAVAAPPADGRPRIVLVIDDMGVDRKHSAEAIRLPAPLTLSFLTYADDLERQTHAAREAGHELMLHVPMEPGDPTLDPGTKVLTVGAPAGETRERLVWGMERFRGYVGINNHMGSKFTRDLNGMTVVITELKSRGLLFLDSRTAGGTVGGTLARRMGVPYEERNVFLDNQNDPAEVEKRLTELEALARKRGHAIAIGHPKAATIKTLTEWLPKARERGLMLVPLSAVVREPGSPS